MSPGAFALGLAMITLAACAARDRQAGTRGDLGGAGPVSDTQTSSTRDEARMHEVVQQPVNRPSARKAGVDVDSEVTPPQVASIIRSGKSELESSATTAAQNKGDTLSAPPGPSPTRAGDVTIYYRCPACKGEHPLLMMQTDSRATFESLVFRNNSEPCPKTGQQVLLDKSQLFWKDQAAKKL
jgi:hypothetical protein